MREIKFRAWDGVLKEFFQLEDSISNTFWADGKLCGIQGCIELQQFTGLKDKNGKEIYEGDILTKNKLKSKYARRSPHDNYIVMSKNGKYVIEIYNGDFKIHPDLYDIYGLEVIGNIHENPELLNETTKT